MNFWFECFAENANGKTHQTHANWPEPLHIDTAATSMNFREFDIQQNEDRLGESWPVLWMNVYDGDKEQAKEHYRYVESHERLLSVVDKLSGDDPYRTVILDNTADLRVLAAKHYVEQQGKDWPQREEWGRVNDMLDEVFQQVLQTHHLVMISQMTDEYQDGDKTGERVWDGPKRAPFKCDFRLKIEIDEEGTRDVKVIKNRFVDRASDDWVANLGSEADFETLMHVSGIPESEW